MVKEAQPVCIHSSFSKRFEIASTRKLEQVISTGVHPKQHKEKRENKNPEIPRNPILCVRDHGDLKNTWSLNQSKWPQRRLIVKRGFLLHHQFKHAQDWVIRGYKKRVCGSNSYRQSISMCGNWSTVTPPYGKPFVLTEPHINTLIQRVLNFAASYERCVLFAE